MSNLLKSIIPAACLLLCMAASPQAAKLDHWSPAQLMERAQHLRQLAAQGNGSASETLEKYPNHYTMLAFRNRSGGAELHQNFADVFYILDGRATLMTGGEVVDSKTGTPGEIRGTSVKAAPRRNSRRAMSCTFPQACRIRCSCPKAAPSLTSSSRFRKAAEGSGGNGTLARTWSRNSDLTPIESLYNRSREVYASQLANVFCPLQAPVL